MEYSNINIKEILNSSIQNLDVKNEAEKSTIHKLINSDTNNFHFYDILIDNDITLNQESDRISFINKTKNNTQIFKSIHDRFGATKILSNNQKKFMINANNDSIYDSKILNDMKKEVAYNKMLLGEIYQKMSVEPPKKLDQKKKNIQKEENFDAEIIDNEIDLWEKKNLKKLESQISTHHKSKSYSFKILENPIHTTNKLKLPSLIQDEKLDFEKKYSPNQEEIFKNFKNEIYLDGTFRKLITNYTKFSLDCNENHDFSEYSINAENIEDLMKEIQFFFTIRLDEQWSTIIEKTNFFESNRNYIDKKIQTKIRNSEVFINNKQLNSILFRKENIVIIEKMSKIKNLMQEIHLYILKSNAKNQDIDRNKNKNKYVRHNTILGEKSPEIVTNVNEIEKKHKRSSLGKFLEKSIELLNKEKELHVLKTNLMKFEEMLKINRGILTNLEDEIKKEKTILKEIFYLRKNFWIKLLKQGLDCGMEEGISWIIRSLSCVGYEIKLGNLPDFLDSKGKDFIQNKAKLEKELRELETMSSISIESYTSNQKKKDFFIIDDMKEISTEKKKSHPLKLIEKFETEPMEFKPIYEQDKKSLNHKIYIEMRKKLREVIPNSINQDFSNSESIPNINLKKGSVFLNPNMSDVLENSLSLFENENSVNNYHSRSEFVKSFEILQKQIQDKKSLIFNEERKEITRIIKEFDYKQYSKRFLIDCDTVLAASIGAKKANYELIRNGMVKKNIKI